MNAAPYRRMLVSAVFALCLTGPVHAEEPAIDPLTGLKLAEDWELVRNNCIACHSLKLVTQQRGDAEHWLGLIRWMQKSQNLWQFDPDTEARILRYLATNYPPSDQQRRTALPAALMPPNPYASDAGD